MPFVTIAVVFISSLTYRFIEAPCINIGKKIQNIYRFNGKKHCNVLNTFDRLGSKIMSLASNAKWNMSSQFFKMIAQLVNIIYLAKLIPPSEYGIMAMALVVVNLGILLRDLGTSAAIIQRKRFIS
ncbi:oligosaccharide flippase family protein [Klebsiella pneumoniae subsp. pneumoniae]|nr:oligosaccharide flippase family protein [Klebsiella pneumoniae subsp. pneumoniae]